MTKQPKKRFGHGDKSRARVRVTKSFADIFNLAPPDKAHSYETVLGILLAGTQIVFGLLMIPLLFSALIAGNTYVFGRIFVCAFILIFVGGLFILWKKYRHYKTAASLLVAFYGLITIIGLLIWGINTPFVILMAGLVVALSGILLGSKVTLWTAGILSLALLTVQILFDALIITPQPQTLYPSRYGDIMGYSILLGILALVTWISNRQMERSLGQALRAEDELQKEKQSLAEKLEQRTQLLKATQLQEMQQLYRFAELGQLSTALLHDLSNHLTVLTLDIEDLDKRQHSGAINRAKHSMVYLDKIVDQVRTRLREERKIEKINLRAAIEEALEQLRTRAQNYQIPIQYSIATNAQGTVVTGDHVRLNQVLTILISNAIDACRDSRQGFGIKIDIRAVDKSVKISVRDSGAGVRAADYNKLFKPFYSTKEDGMGIGLFIARQMVQSHFNGEITHHHSERTTEFMVTLPVNDHL